MQYSTNYNLNLVEGTDIVNPLVIDKPNYQTIDGAMKDNADAGISTATEIKTGTVHAITRTNGDANAFRFVATSVFNSGDTFTVDGVTVTALLPSGESLGDNAYVIGSNVFAILTSTELTIFTVGGTAADAKLLNGEPGTFYTDSTNINYDNTLSGLTATTAQGAIDELSPVIKINDPSIVLSRTNAIHPTLLVGSNNPGNGGDTMYYKIGTKVSLNIAMQSLPSNAGSTIFILPIGYRPHSTIVINGMGSSTGTTCDILIYSNGDVVISTPAGESYCEGYVTFDAFDPS